MKKDSTKLSEKLLEDVSGGVINLPQRDLSRAPAQFSKVDSKYVYITQEGATCAAMIEKKSYYAATKMTPKQIETFEEMVNSPEEYEWKSKKQ